MSVDVVIASAPPPAAAARSKRDFAEWLSPILVKELRQGMRTRTFVGTFILLQVVMLLNVIIGILNASLMGSSIGYDPSTTGVTAFFWIVVSIPLLLIVPLMGQNTISAEIKANTLELIFLTRLTAWRIVVGKWLALFAQSVLFVCAILPYAVLRYFIGGVNLVHEVVSIGWILAGSGLLTAITVGLSPFPNRLVRPFLVIGLLIGLQGSSFFFLRAVGIGVSSSPLHSGSWFAFETGLVGLGLVLLFLMFELGSGKIAPAAENHSARKRMLGVLLLAGTAGLVPFLGPAGAAFFTVAALMLVVVICIDALCEPSRWIPSIFAPFMYRGRLGCSAVRLFYPGWSSAFLFTLLMLTGFGFIFWGIGSFSDAESFFQYVALWGAIFLPVAITRATVANEEKAFTSFFALQVGFGVITIVAMILAESLKLEFRGLVSVIPTSALMMSIVDSEPPDGVFDTWQLMTGTTVLSVIYLLFALRLPWRQAQEAEREALRISSGNGTVA